MLLQSLVNEKQTSCGCWQKEKNKKVHTTHNLSKNNPLYKVWHGMKQRCGNPNSQSYSDYGGRGITFSPEWDDYLVFHNWAISEGWEKGLEIDRTDNDKGYSPGNCRIVGRCENMRNTRRNNNLTINNITKCITDWANENNIPVKALYYRTKKWPQEKWFIPLMEQYRKGKKGTVYISTANT